MSCKELFEMFKKNGEKLECHYITKKCTIIPQNLSCDTTPDTYNDIEDLIGNFGYNPYVKVIHIPLNWIRPVFIERIHKYQIKDTIGFTMKINNDEKIWYQNNGYKLKN
jgi:hypothetical protein